MGSILLSNTRVQRHMLIAFYVAKNLVICRCKRLPNLSLLSTSRRPKRWPHIPPTLLARADEVIE